MQGKKNYQEKLFTSFQLSDRIPEHNFYRRLKDILDLDISTPLPKNSMVIAGKKALILWFSSRSVWWDIWKILRPIGG